MPREPYIAGHTISLLQSMPYRTRPALQSLLLVCLFLPAAASAQGEWTDVDTRRVVENTSVLRLAPDLSHLSAAEQTVVDNLLVAGRLFQELYEDQKHPDATWARESLEEGSPEAHLYRLYRGPIGTNGNNQRAAFMGVRPETPGKNVYPIGVTREEMDAYLAAHPDERISLLDLRSVVRRATPVRLDRDLATLEAWPGLRLLHPSLQQRLSTLRERPSEDIFYTIPYAVAYADRIMRIHDLLRESADAMQGEDRDFASYLRLRANDLLTSNYEPGDAAWVLGDFNNLNVQIGSYETYDDALFGVKAFYSLSLLVRDQERSEALVSALTDIQALENSLPYDRHKTVRSRIPVSVYNVIADFGQSRGTNTATILPNDADHARKYGRTILLRYNIMTNPQLFESSHNRFCAAVLAEHCNDLTLDGNFQRTLWHEIGHYLGTDRTVDGRTLAEAFQDYQNLYEEMKSDLVSLFVAEQLHASGYYTDEALRSVYAGGIRRVVQSREPRRDQPYQTMQLMQWNWYLENGLVTLDEQEGRLAIHYDRYHEVVESLLREILDLLSSGDLQRAEDFVDEWTTWNEGLHGVIAHSVANAPGGGYRLVRYGAMGE